MRKNLSASVRVAIYKRHNGLCDICGGSIDGKAWDVSHRIPLEMGGADDESNWFPAHRTCHREITKADLANIAKAKRREARDIGVKKQSRGFRGWRKFSGELVWRDER